MLYDWIYTIHAIHFIHFKARAPKQTASESGPARLEGGPQLVLFALSYFRVFVTLPD
jgi:hypothetical protein